jgi:hypothetical protein
VKLSAPPPPPPPPPEQPAPGTPQPEGSGAPPEPVAPAAVPPAADTKPATWPAWFGGCDSFLAALALVVALACGSFAAHNSDLWLHLATGKKLFAGDYFPGGGDPFSYAAEGRAWVNHSWLTDAVAYLLYGGDGKVLVAAKALLLVLALGLLIGLRRAPHALWPWAAVGAVAALACAPQLMLRPLVVSLPFLAVTLFLMFRVTYRADSWRFPGLIAGTFWLWANCDQWFFLGPLALALVALGEAVQAKVFANPEAPAPDGEVEPLGRYPELPLLLKALALGVAACTLTPHHVRVWELPVELTGLAGIADDPRLRPLLYAPIDSAYVSNAGLGYNLNGLAYAVLFVAGAVGLGFGPGRVRAAHLALWIGFAALSLVSVYAIPFFALVSVPLIAAQCNALSAGVALKTTGDPRTRLLLLSSVLGRGACLLAGLAACVAAYPGWLHPDTANPAFARRLEWAVVPEPGLVRGAEQFAAWRASGALPADARGVIAHPDLANYVAWFAPGERVLWNGRVSHHKPELADYLAARRAAALLDTRDPRDRKTDPPAAAELLKKLGAEYYVLHAGPADSLLSRELTERVALVFATSGDGWVPWIADGRTAAFGWRGSGKPTAAALKLDPVALAYGPNVARLPEFELKPPLVELGWEESFVRAPRPAPVAAAEAFGWLGYKAGPSARQEQRQLIRERVLAPLFVATPGATDRTAHQLALQCAAAGGALRFPFDAAEAQADARANRAAALLALRAARRAIAADPDHPDGYAALARVLRDPDAPFSPGERSVGGAIACRQYLDRVAKPGTYRRAQVAVPASEMALLLADIYTGQQIAVRDPGSREPRVVFVGMSVDAPGFAQLFGGYLVETPRGPARVPQVPPGARSFSGTTPVYFAADAALEALQLAQQYLAADSAGLPPDATQERAAQIEAAIAAVKRSVVEARERIAPRPGTKLAEQVAAAQQVGLPQAALGLLRDAEAEVQKEFGPQAPVALGLRCALELLHGRPENGAELLDRLTEPGNAAALGQFLPIVRELKYQQAVHLGDFRGAGRVREEAEGRALGTDELLKGIAEAKVVPADLLREPFAAWPPVGTGAGLAGLLFRSETERRADDANRARQLLALKLDADAGFFLRRGQLALIEGDIAGARTRFEQAKRTPPPGWYLDPVDPAAAREYVDLIDRAAKGKK